MFSFDFCTFLGCDFFDVGPFLSSFLASFRSQIDPPNLIWTESHQFWTISDDFMTFQFLAIGRAAIFYSRYLFGVRVTIKSWTTIAHPHVLILVAPRFPYIGTLIVFHSHMIMFCES